SFSEAFFAKLEPKLSGNPYFRFVSAIYCAISTSRSNAPKFESVRYIARAFLLAIKSISFFTRSRSKRENFCKVADPQSQNVHPKGHPRLVSSIIPSMELKEGSSNSPVK